MKQVLLSLTLLKTASKQDSFGRYPVVLRVYDPGVGKAKVYRTGTFANINELESVEFDLNFFLKR